MHACSPLVARARILKAKGFYWGHTMLINKCSGNSLFILNQISIFKIYIHRDHLMFMNSKNVLTYCFTDNLIGATSIFKKKLSHVFGVLQCFRKVFCFIVQWSELNNSFWPYESGIFFYTITISIVKSWGFLKFPLILFKSIFVLS